MRLLNVRLSPDDARRVAALRRAGVPISRLVRDAIRAEHGRRAGGRGRGETAAQLVARIYTEHPDPPGLAPRRYDLRDRRAVRREITRRLRRQRRS
jgi:hypothetical protein